MENNNKLADYRSHHVPVQYIQGSQSGSVNGSRNDNDRKYKPVNNNSPYVKLSLLNYVPFVPTCITCLRAYVPYVPMRFTCLRAIVLQITRCLRAFRTYVPYVPTCLRTFIFHVPTCLHAYIYFSCLRAFVP